MSSSTAAKRLKALFTTTLPQPPAPSEHAGSALTEARKRKPGRPPKAEKMVQLNLRVPQRVKDRLRVLAARDRIEMSQIAIEGIELYEAKYGAAPELHAKRRAE